MVQSQSSFPVCHPRVNRLNRSCHSKYRKTDTKPRNRQGTAATHDNTLKSIRNQLIHGGATWQNSVNRDQVRDGSRILADLVPAMIHLVMQNPENDWGDVCYPPMNRAE